MSLGIRFWAPRHKAAGKLADAEVHFEDGPLAGLTLEGFAIWETAGRRTVTVPSRHYVANGQRKTFALLRGDGDASERMRAAMLQAYQEWEARCPPTT